MSSSEISDEKKRIKLASYRYQLKNVINLSTKFSDDVKLLSETLIKLCWQGHLDVVKWMVECTAADINYTKLIRGRYTWGEEGDLYYTPLTAAFRCKHLDVVKYLVEISCVDVNLPDSERVTHH